MLESQIKIIVRDMLREEPETFAEALGIEIDKCSGDCEFCPKVDNLKNELESKEYHIRDLKHEIEKLQDNLQIKTNAYNKLLEKHKEILNELEELQ